MTEWSDSLADLDDTVAGTAGFGEVVTPHGQPPLMGIFDPSPEAAPGRWPDEAWQSAGMLQRPPPILWLHTADASELTEAQLITVRATEYAISRIDRTAMDGDLVRLILRPVK